jgi:hypothetical protein
MKLAHKSDGFSTIGKPIVVEKVEKTGDIVIETEKPVVIARKYMAETTEFLSIKAEGLREAMRLTTAQGVSADSVTVALLEVEEELTLRSKLK